MRGGGAGSGRNAPRRRLADPAVLRTTVRHIVLPGHEIARIEPRRRETIAGLLRRSGWAKRHRVRGWQFRLPTICVVNGEPVRQREWRSTKIRAGDRVEFWSRPLGAGQQNGGKQTLGLVALIAVAALSLFAPFLAAGAGLGFLAPGTIGGALLTAGIGLGGSLLISALTTPRAGAQNQDAAAGTQGTDQVLSSIQAAGNQVRPFSPIPVSYGRIRTFPDFAATPWSEYSGNDQYLNVLLSLGLGKYSAEAIYLDDTLLWDSGTGVQSGFDAQIAFYDPDETVSLFPTNVVSSGEVSGQEITETPVGYFVASASGTEASYLAVDIIFPGGLYSVPSNATDVNQIANASVTVVADYQEVDGAGAPVGSPAQLFSQTFTRATKNPIRETIKTAVTPKRYQVRVYRTDAPNVPVGGGGLSSGQGYRGNTSGALVDNVAWAGLRAFIDGVASFPVSTTAIRIKADRLNANSSRKFGVLRTRILNVWTGSAFEEQATRNPIWAFYDAAVDTTYGASRPPSKIDFNTVVSAATAADTRGDKFDYEFASAVIVPEALDLILRTTRTRHFWSGDVISIVRDEESAVPDMLITDREIVRGSLALEYRLNDDVAADAVRLEYVDENTWRPADVQYPPNDLEFTSVAPATIRVDGVVQRDQAHQEASFYYLQSIYRRIGVTLDTEWDGRRLTYGTHVRVQSELPQTWGQSGAILGVETRTLTVDPAPSWADAGTKYTRIRTATGRVFGPVISTQGATEEEIVLDETDLGAVETAQSMTLAQATAREDGGEFPSYDFGTATKTSRDCIVLSGRPNGDNRISLELAVDNPLIYSTDIGSPPILPSANLPAAVKTPIVAGLNASFRQGVAEPILEASWFPADGAEYYRARLSYDGGNSYVQIYEGIGSHFSMVVDRVALRLQVAGIGAAHGPWATVDVDAPAITVAQQTVAVSSMIAGLGDFVTNEFNRIADRIRQLDQIIASAAADADATNWLDRRETRSDLVYANGRISQVSTLASTIDGRLVGAYTVNIDINGYVTGFNLYDDGEFSAFVLKADVFSVGWPGYDSQTVFQIANVGGVAKITFTGDMFADGAIIARTIGAGAVEADKIAANAVIAGKIAANAITAGTIQADAVTTSKLIADAAARIDSVVQANPTFYFDTANHTLCSVPVTSVTGKYVIDCNIEWDGTLGFTNTGASQYYLVAELVLDGTTVLDTFYIAPYCTGISGSSLNFYFIGPFTSKAKATISAGSHSLALRVRSYNNVSPGTARTAKEASIVAFEQRDNG